MEHYTRRPYRVKSPLLWFLTIRCTDSILRRLFTEFVLRRRLGYNKKCVSKNNMYPLFSKSQTVRLTIFIVYVLSCLYKKTVYLRNPISFGLELTDIFILHYHTITQKKEVSPCNKVCIHSFIN